MSKSITLHGKKVTVTSADDSGYLSLTEIAKSVNGDGSLIDSWLKSKDTLEYLAVWESIHNSENFNSLEFAGIRSDAGSNRYSISVKEWREKTNAVGIYAKAGRHGGTFAHVDIALEFATWLSPELRLHVIKEFQRLKADENRQQLPEWNLNRTLAKVNYRLHTDAVRDKLIPPTLAKKDIKFVYASEGDLVNKAVFGQTAKEWRDANKGKVGNIRDSASVEQLLVLANIESYNSVLVRQGRSQSERIKELNEVARSQLKALMELPAVKSLKPPPLLNPKTP